MRPIRLLVSLGAGLGLTLVIGLMLSTGRETRAAPQAPSGSAPRVYPPGAAATPYAPEATTGTRSGVPKGLSPTTQNIILAQLNQVHSYLFRQTAKLTATDGIPGDEFGYAVAIDHRAVVIGAPYDDDNGIGSGSAYVFTRNGDDVDNWGLTAHLSATDGTNSDAFGGSVAISGDTIVVGAFGADLQGAECGAAYVFERNQGGADHWGQTVKITATGGMDYDEFGSSVDISGDTIVVGAPGDDSQGLDSGAAYVFERDQGGADSWRQTAKISPTISEAEAYFGLAVAMDGDTIVVGAPGDDSQGLDSGAAYVFTRDQGGTDHWGQTAKITTTGGTSGGAFGRSVAIEGETTVVGAPEEDRVYIFGRNQGGTDQWGYIRDHAVGSGDDFGTSTSVAVDGNTAAVGAWGDAGEGTDAGAVFIFRRNEGGIENWGQIAKIVADDAAPYDEFGWAVALDGNVILVGSHNDDSGTGAAYVYWEVPFAIYLPLALRDHP